METTPINQIIKVLLEVQELDMKMIQLMRVKKERQKELHQIESLRTELGGQLKDKEVEVKELAKTIQLQELRIEEIEEKIKKLEEQQSAVKKVDEFNALTKELTAAEREKITLEHEVSDLVDRKNSEEEILKKITESLQSSEASSLALEKEIREGIQKVNEEGIALKAQRDTLAQEADPETLAIYDRLLHNKRDRVIVPIENRCCSGCHIELTAQHENLVRKGKKLVFCEHCSRIHYWQESEAAEGAEGASTKKRRRRATARAGA